MHHRALFDAGQSPTRRAVHVTCHLLDHQFHIGAVSHVRENPDVFEAHQGTDDLARVGDDEGASGKLAHTTTLEHLRQFLGDLRQGATPLRSEDPVCIQVLGSNSADVPLAEWRSLAAALSS